ncbi:hypothetical protein AZE42_03380 [Rhizopogon vesiculosus]|uniref:Ketoreductase (KR) domain-containing protein n=1 Tax=Rhizopogon vesiculosus TaxID=180088 RepID=A0A1J8Q5L1_9AGAM|nr:hypothetical protein AZE42_03380 [Rhizopogon vesiculosus]
MGKLSFWSFLSEQIRDLPLPKESANGRTIVVAGANIGLGLEASIHFGSKKPDLLIATCRDAAKCEQTLEVIRERCAETQPTSIDSWPLELSSFDSVRSFADRFDVEGPEHLDVLVANAGTFTLVYTQTQDDWEIMLQVNYLSLALLSILLLPHLLRSTTCDDPSRLVLVSSLGHYQCDPMLKDAHIWDDVLGTINTERFGAPAQSRYNLSKLFQVAFARELAARLPSPTPLVVTAVNPGLCHSSIMRNAKNSLFGIFFAVVKWLFARTTEMGSRNIVYAALATNEQAMHGKYMSGCEVVEECDYLLSAEGKVFSQKLWRDTIHVLSKVDDRVSQIISMYLPAK